MTPAPRFARAQWFALMLAAVALGAVVVVPMPPASGQTPPTVALEFFPVERPCTMLYNFGDPRGDRTHEGEDIAAAQGQDVYAGLPGVVENVWVDTGQTYGAGNGLQIERADGTFTRYFHLNDFAPGVVQGSTIVTGQLIGHVGETGTSGNGNANQNFHLHFELHPGGGAAIDPAPGLDALGGCSGTGGTTPPAPTPPPGPETPIEVTGDPTGFVAMSPERRLDTRSAEVAGADGAGKAVSRVSAGGVVQVALDGVVPDSAAAVALNVTAAGPDAAGFLTAYPCGPVPLTSTVNYRRDQTVPGAVIVGLSADRSVCVTTYAPTDVVVDLAGWFEPVGGSVLMPLTPTRLLDTRADGGGRLAAGDTLAVDVTAGDSGIPASATAVALNVTATDAVGAGYVTAWPCDHPEPVASNLNPIAGATVANLVNVAVGAAGKVCFTSFGATHLVIDALGWFAPDSSAGGARLTPVEPTRVVDTRSDLAGDRLAANETLTVDLRARAGLPDDVTAVQATVTVTEPSSAGYLTAWPCGERPLASNVNYTGGATVANGAQVTLSADGELCLFSLKATDVIVDITGVWRSSG